MKILFLADDFPPQSFGGAGISTYELALGMKKAGHQVFAITTCRKESESGELNYNGIKVFKIANDYSEKWRAYLGLYNPPVTRKVEEILKDLKPDVVHANNVHYYLSYYCLKLAKKYAKAVVFTARDTMAIGYGKLETKRYLENFDYRVTWFDNLKQAKKRWNPLRNFAIRYFLNHCVDQIFSVSLAIKKALEKNGIKNVKVMHTGADLSVLPILDEQVTQFKKEYGLENKKILLFAGRISWSKGGGKILEALASMVVVESSTVLLISGPADGYAQVMLKQAQKDNLSTNLVFTGWLDSERMRLAYAAADVVLVPSLHLDAFPRTVIEAMASSRPVVGTCYGGAPEIIVDGVTGYIVNPFKTGELADSVLDLLKDPLKAEKFGRAGYKRIKTDFNLREKIDQIISHYQLLIDRK